MKWTKVARTLETVKAIALLAVASRFMLGEPAVGDPLFRHFETAIPYDGVWGAIFLASAAWIFWSQFAPLTVRIVAEFGAVVFWSWCFLFLAAISFDILAVRLILAFVVISLIALFTIVAEYTEHAFREIEDVG